MESKSELNPIPIPAEAKRLQETREGKTGWKEWGPYLSERAWGTVREDYSANGDHRDLVLEGGDTAIFSDMGLINEIYAPEIGFVPIGDRYTMGAKTAALACKRFFDFELVVLEGAGSPAEINLASIDLTNARAARQARRVVQQCLGRSHLDQ